MSGGVVQLIAVGAQDVHIMGDPQISFFKSYYKRHTNFAQFVERQTIQGNVKNNGMSTIRIEKRGDLLTYMFLTAFINNAVQTIADWSTIIDKIELLIGGQVIDTQDTTFTEEIAIDTMSNTYTKGPAAALHSGTGTQSEFYPLRFFCCENWQSAIPLIALHYHEVELRITWGPGAEGYSIQFAGNFIALGDEERRLYMDTPTRDILIFQIQKSIPTGETIQDLNFNHPVKFLASSNLSSTSSNPLTSLTNEIKFEINGVDITEFKSSAPYYTSIPSYYHTQYSRGNFTAIFINPFCLDTSKFQPCGTLNFSRVSSFRVISREVLTQPIYAVNYNILRVQNGMAGVVYAN
jgi:hypothetical protein